MFFRERRTQESSRNLFALCCSLTWRIKHLWQTRPFQIARKRHHAIPTLTPPCPKLKILKTPTHPPTRHKMNNHVPVISFLRGPVFRNRPSLRSIKSDETLVEIPVPIRHGPVSVDQRAVLSVAEDAGSILLLEDLHLPGFLICRQ